MKAVRLHAYHQQPVVEEVPEPTVTGPFDVLVRDRRRRRLPHRPAHRRGPVGRGDGPAAAVHARARERRLGARGRLGRDQRGRRRHGDPAPDADLRAVPGLPGRQRHALRQQLVPRAVRRRRDGRATCSPRSGRASSSTRPPSRRTSPRWPTPGSPPTTRSARRCRCCTRAPRAVVIGAGGLGHIGIQCLAALTATRIIVVDRNPEALKLAEQIGANETVVADGGQVDAVKDLTGGGATVVLRLRRRAGRREGRVRDDRAGRLVLRHRVRRHASRSRPWTSSPPSATSSGTSSAPTTTSPS